MKFNISQKTDPETKDFKVVIEGDKEFNDNLNKYAMLFNDTMRVFLNQIIRIYNTKNQKPLTHDEETFIDSLTTEKQKPYTPTKLTKVDGLSVDRPYTIAVNGYMADLIIGANQRLIDKIVLIRDSDGKAIGLTIN